MCLFPSVFYKRNLHECFSLECLHAGQSFLFRSDLHLASLRFLLLKDLHCSQKSVFLDGKGFLDFILYLKLLNIACLKASYFVVWIFIGTKGPIMVDSRGSFFCWWQHNHQWFIFHFMKLNAQMSASSFSSMIHRHWFLCEDFWKLKEVLSHFQDTLSWVFWTWGLSSPNFLDQLILLKYSPTFDLHFSFLDHWSFQDIFKSSGSFW